MGFRGIQISLPSAANIGKSVLSGIGAVNSLNRA